MDDFLIVEQAQAVELKEKQLIEKIKVLPDTKTQMKKAVNTKCKLIKKQTKGQGKAINKSKNLNMDIMKLVLSNRQANARVRLFKDIFSNSVFRNNNELEGSPALGKRAK